MEGVQLLAVYAILALGFYFCRRPREAARVDHLADHKGPRRYPIPLLPNFPAARLPNVPAT
jgi:hypothetical protein